jgi:hypothetical protein
VILEVNNDITARRLAEDALREADRNKDRFLATLAHESPQFVWGLRESLPKIVLICQRHNKSTSVAGAKMHQ